MEKLQVVTYNIHKGFSQFKRRMSVHDLRERLRGIGADVVFLQEVQGAHETNSVRHSNWPLAPQHEFLADSIWKDFAYGKNAVYDHGHHGNAILSKYPISRWDNIDISMHDSESRGLLHCEMAIPGWRHSLHCVNVHLGLLGHWRKKQISLIKNRIEQLVPADAPLVIAGDFNDWRRYASDALVKSLEVEEVFETTSGRPARSYPAILPMLHLDRIYVRGFSIELAQAHHGPAWSKVSDHIALSARLVRKV
ncbi:MAG TPA: endonuclease/exonuclease/phosphatase family protein [Burkholderiales bacterium]|jgi:endonuclease/exonuclease/phosphatase family metal-dependent hydrolase|nr:endonuclease/exonuclease/phosphatase family protein [Burkholderiales bacterium]